MVCGQKLMYKLLLPSSFPKLNRCYTPLVDGVVRNWCMSSFGDGDDNDDGGDGDEKPGVFKKVKCHARAHKGS